MESTLSGPPRSLVSLGSIRPTMPRERRRANCLLLSLRLSTGPDRRVLVP